MRLINTKSLELEEFFGRPIPEYAILSHRWGDDEVSYKDYVKSRKPDSAGHVKILDCCAFARQRGQSYVWVDTCCIDKRSSAKLSEAINSMFRWYSNAAECNVHLADIPHAPWRPTKHILREWLGELLAPAYIVFCANDWTTLGFRAAPHPSVEELRCWITPVEGMLELEDPSVLNNTLDVITGVPVQVLSCPGRIRDYCVAQKMSWAAGRVTSRPEDQAYCLLGIFEINLPLLYGEGTKAFMRLQYEIIRSYNDESIFAFHRYGQESTEDEPAYGAPRPPPFHTSVVYPLLASSPWMFRDCHNTVILKTNHAYVRPPYLMTNQGMEFRLSADQGVVVPKDIRDQSTLHFPLRCAWWSRSRASGSKPSKDLFSVCLQRQECGHFAVVWLGLSSPLMADGRIPDWKPLNASMTVWVHAGVRCSS